MPWSLRPTWDRAAESIKKRRYDDGPLRIHDLDELDPVSEALTEGDIDTAISRAAVKSVTVSEPAGRVYRH
jgi:hypothetical protein